LKVCVTKYLYNIFVSIRKMNEILVYHD